MPRSFLALLCAPANVHHIAVCGRQRSGLRWTLIACSPSALFPTPHQGGVLLSLTIMAMVEPTLVSMVRTMQGYK